MKPLIAIYSCQNDVHNGRNDAIRETWGKRSEKYADVKFFVGGNISGACDYIGNNVVWLDAYDGGDNLVYKEIEMFRWALNEGYERILKTETDAYLNVKKIFETIDLNKKIILESGHAFENPDCVGSLVGEKFGDTLNDTCIYTFIQGHAVWYSRKAMQYIVDEMLETALRIGPSVKSPHVNTTLRSADLWESQVLTPRWLRGDITMANDRRYGTEFSRHCPGDQKTNAPNWMRKTHEEMHHAV